MMCKLSLQALVYALTSYEYVNVFFFVMIIVLMIMTRFHEASLRITAVLW